MKKEFDLGDSCIRTPRDWRRRPEYKFKERSNA